MKILYITDLHGKFYEDVFSIAKDLKVDMVINGGDMLPKGGDIFLQQGYFISNFLDSYFAKFEENKIHYLGYLGNDDLKIFDGLFDDICNKYKYIENMAQRKVTIGGYEFIGFNWVVDYPFRLKDRCRMDGKDYVFQKQFGTPLFSTAGGYREEKDWFSLARGLTTIEENLNWLVRPDDMDKAIYVIHMPPSRIGLDMCYGSREVGSNAIYEFIEREQPLLSLHGHIHESPDVTGIWKANIGDTTCVQPGQIKNTLTYAVIDLPSMKIERRIK